MFNRKKLRLTAITLFGAMAVSCTGITANLAEAGPRDHRPPGPPHHEPAPPHHPPMWGGPDDNHRKPAPPPPQRGRDHQPDHRRW